MSEEVNKEYDVLLTVQLSRHFTIKAASAKQARRVMKKIMYYDGVSEYGIEWDSGIWEDANSGHVFKNGLAPCDKKVALSLSDGGSTGEYDQFDCEINE
tara:strand:- start:5427 stop:5723 length:297 start_codon:yes stop_codon:yes gene_type:complete